jgi:hypothetical protein
VTSGGFGLALEGFTDTHNVSDQDVQLLWQSSTFRGLVSNLDKHYTWADDPRFARDPNKLEVGADGVVKAPSAAKGKRAVTITAGGGARFESFGALSNQLSSDLIALDNSSGPEFISQIAHEATHAANFVGASAPNAQSIPDEVEAGIQDEIKARKGEAKVLGEINNPAVKAAISQVAPIDAWQVERDVSPGIGVTYLEAAFFEREARDARAAENIDDLRAEKIRKEIDDYWGSVLLKPNTDYGQAIFDRKKAAEDWQEFEQTHSRSSSTYQAEKEKLIQKHATKYFKGKISYRPLPAAASPGATSKP